MAIYTRPANYKVINDNEDKTYEEYMNERSFRVVVEANQDLISLFEKHGWARRGKHTWSLFQGAENEDKFSGFVYEYSEKFSPSTLACNENASGNALTWNMATFTL